MVRGLRAAYPTQLSMLRELFPSWSDEDLLFVTHECSGEVELAVGRISEGHAEQFSSVKSKKDLKKEAADKAAAAPPPAPAPSAAPEPTSRRARHAERGARGRGAAAPAARAGRGGFRGVARGAATASSDTRPVAATNAVFNVAQKDEPAKTPESKPTRGATVSWAQVARPAEPKPEPPAKPPAPEPAAQPEKPADTTAPPTEAPLPPPTTTSVAPATVPAAPAPSEAPATTAAPPARSRAQRPQDAAVVMPGGAAALDHLGVQFGTLNFMGGDAAEAPAPAPEAPAADAPLDRFDMDGSRELGTSLHFKSSPFGNAYGLSRPVGEAPEAPLPYTQPTTAPAYSSLYALERPSVGSAFRGDERGAAGGGAAGAAAPAAPEPPSMQQQPFPNMMPYYYPYYMPNQFQHFSPAAAGFGQYPLYGQQPQQPSKPDVPPANLSSPYVAHDMAAAAAPYGTHTPPQPTAAYDQGFAQRMPALGTDFRLQGDANATGAASSTASTATTTLPGLSFLGNAPAPPSAPASQHRAGANASIPLDYRGPFDASKSPPTRAQPAPAPQPAPQGTQAPQPHPAYYQQYAGFGQASYGGYPYTRQQYWG